jgi:F-type H+-transporting ATPase subunit epsilon
MAETLELEIATPERELVREQVNEVQLPGKNGYMGILPGHAALVGLLGIGMLSYVRGSEKHYMAVHGGFLEVADDHVRVLADNAEHASEIDVERAQSALRRAQEAGMNPALGVDPAAALEAVERAEARLAAADKK